MKKAILLTAIAAITLTACGASGTKSKDKQAAATEQAAIEQGTLRVYSFHGDQRCITCRAIEKLAKEVVAELKNDNIDLKVINISDKANEALADKYEVTWSSLVLDNGKTANNVTEMAFSYAKNQPDVFKKNLKAEIAKLL